MKYERRYLRKRKAFHKLTAALCALALALSLVPAAQAADTPAVSDNINANTYPGAGISGGYYAATVRSYLFDNGNGLTRVEYLGNNRIIVEDYTSSFQLRSSRTIPFELSIWGGFFAGQNYNFFVFGQKNDAENDSVEVVRVVKYDKSWNRLGQASVYGANTKVPFDAGSLRCAESAEMLYIHTCHTMYKHTDGINHQANMNLVVRQSDMQVMKTGHGIGGYTGCVSHSFNQFILFDQSGRLVTADHGDGSPRALEVIRYGGTDGFCEKTVTDAASKSRVQEFPGSFGALAETSSGSFSGNKTITRAETCAVINRLYNAINS